MTPLAPLALARSGAIIVPLRLLTCACAFSAAPRHRRAAGFKSYGFMASQMGNSPQTPIRGAARHLSGKSGLDRSGRRRPRHATDAVSARRGTCERHRRNRTTKWNCSSELGRSAKAMPSGFATSGSRYRAPCLSVTQSAISSMTGNAGRSSERQNATTTASCDSRGASTRV